MLQSYLLLEGFVVTFVDFFAAGFLAIVSVVFFVVDLCATDFFVGLLGLSVLAPLRILTSSSCPSAKDSGVQSSWSLAWTSPPFGTNNLTTSRFIQ